MRILIRAYIVLAAIVTLAILYGVVLPHAVSSRDTLHVVVGLITAISVGPMTIWATYKLITPKKEKQQ